MKRLLVYIFIPILAILVMSHNTFAYEMANSDVSYYGTYTDIRTYCSNNTWSTECAAGTTGHDSLLFYDSNMSLSSGDYFVEVYVEIANWDGNAPLWFGASWSNKMSIISQEQVSSTTRGTATTRVYRIMGRYFGTPTVSSSNYIIIGGNPDLGAWSHWRFLNMSFYRINNGDASNQQIIDAINNISRGPSADEIGDAVNAPQQDAADDIRNQSPSDIGNSTNAETQSLLTAFGSFVSAIASISPSNCNVDFDLGHIDFGEQNLCSVSVPTVFTTITSIIVIMFTIPFVYHLVNRILGLIREMQT